MHALERRRRILELLQQESFVTVEKVQHELGASPATIRRDFADLAHQNLVVRGHGGVHRVDNAPVMGVMPYSRRRSEHSDEKERIAAAAAELLAPGDVVIIDGGSTTVHLAKFLSPLVRVITNSLPLASALNQPAQGTSAVPEVNVTGGYLYPMSEVLLGPQTVQSLKEYNATWCFLSASAINEEGILNSNNLVVDTQREMMARARKTAVLMDSSKFTKTAMVKICPLAALDAIVTDAPPPRHLAAVLQEHDVAVVLAAAVPPAEA